MATWPVTLPDYVLQDGYLEQPPENTIRTKMDVGPPKARRRATSAPRPIKCRQHMTAAQVVTFDTFYVTTLKSGSLPFEWQHPRTGSTVNFMFTEPPSYTPIGAEFYVDMSLEVMP